ncbi:MAG TPA: response regulator [Kofleriaceae bacterium]|nr:response regulator [Kofleriaceae bacterium]
MVLIVDDDEGIRESLADILSDHGYPIATAANGRDALEWLRAQSAPPRAILLDLMMPVMDGWQAMEAIERERLVTRDRIIVITAQRDARVPPGVEAIKKPMTAATVLEAIARRPAVD